MSNSIFSENLKHLPSIDTVERIELSDPQGMPAGIIEHRPGQSGSLAVYNYLLGKYGDINAAAASEGLELYAEHTEDAKENPGKHPNIDRLLTLVLTGSFYTGRIIERPA
jgi:hypothetical protein